MFVTLDIQEINEFPEEIKKFLYNYISKQLSSDNVELGGTSQTDHQIPPPNFSDQSNQLKTSWSEMDPTPTRYGRNLVAGNFDWEQMMQTELPLLSQDLNNQIYIEVDGEDFTLDWGLAHAIEPTEPSTWGFIIILCALFGFGGCIPGLEPARNPKELAKNFEKLGFSGGAPVEPRSIGPLLKSVTKMFDLWQGKFVEGPPVNDLHWFDFDKRGNFYFAGSTFDDCYEAVKNVSEEHFIVAAKSNDA